MTENVNSNIIAKATTQVVDGRSSTYSLKPYGVYNGHYDRTENSAVIDNLNFKSPFTEDMTQHGWTDGGLLMIYVMPTKDFDDFVTRNENYGHILTVEPQIIYYVHNDPTVNAIHTLGSNTLIILKVSIYVTYNHNTSTVGGKDYTWNTETIVTNALTYTEGHSRNDLLPGHTYSINAEYLENDHYKYSRDVGTLEMLKCPTTTTISGTNAIVLGESLTLTVTVTEAQNNSLLNRGSVRIYDGNEIIQNNYTITGTSTQISIIPATTGNHEIYAVFTDSGVEYNTSRSEPLHLTVNKKPTQINTESSLTFYFNEGIVITGELLSGSTPVPSVNVKLVDYDGATLQTTTTGSNGQFTFNNYKPSNWNVDGNSIQILFEGTNEYAQSSKTVGIHMFRHESNHFTVETDGYSDDIIDVPIEFRDENNNDVICGEATVTVEPVLQPYMVYEGTVHSDEKGFECDDITFAHPMGTDNNLSYTNNSKVLFWAVPTTDLEEIIGDIDSNNGKIGLRHTVDLNGENYNTIDYGDITVFISNAPNNQYLRLNDTVITENSGNSHTWTLYRNSLGTGTEEPELRTLRATMPNGQLSQIIYCLASVDADVYQTILESVNTLDQYGYGGAGNITLPCFSTVTVSEMNLYEGKYFIYTKGNYQFTPTYIEFEVDGLTTHEYKKLYGDSALEMIERVESHPEESLFLDLADVTNNQTDKFYLRMSHPVGSERDDCLDELVIEITDENGDVYDNISGGFDYNNNVLNLQLAGEIGTTISFDGIDFEGVSATYNGGIINLSCDYNGFDSLISNGKLTLKGTINLQGIYKTGYRLTVPYEEIPVPIGTYTCPDEEEIRMRPEIGVETPGALYLGDCCEVVISQNVRFDEDYDYLLHFNSINKYTRFGVKDGEGTSHTQRLVNMGVNGGYETHEGIHENIRLFVDQNNLYAEYEGYVGLILSGVGNSEYNFTFYEGSSKMGGIWNNTELVYIRKVRAGNRYRVISDIGVGGIPFSSDSSLIKTAPVNITGEGYLECPENVWRTYYIPDTSVDWTARIKVRIDTTQNYYGHIVYYNTNGPANIHLEKNNSRIYGDTNVLNQPNITSDTGQQEIVIKQENGIITLSYPNSNGGWTSNTFTRPEPSNDRIAIRSLNTNSFYIESFKFTEIIPVGGGNRSMKYLDITDYSVSRDTATSEGTTGSDYQLPFVTDEGNMNLGLRYDFILSEPLDVSGNYTYKVTVYTWNKWIRFGCVSQSGRTYATPYDLGITEIPSDPYTYTLYREGNNFYAELDGIRKPIINNISTSKEYHLYLYNISANVETELISVQKIRTDETVTGTNRRTYLPVSSLDNWIIDRYSATNENKLEEASVEPKMTENGLMLGYRYDCIYEKVLDMTGGHEYYITFTYRNRYTRIGLRRIQNNAIKQNHHTVLQYNEIIPNSPITATYRLFVENGNIKLQSNNNTATLVNGNTATDYRLYLYGLFTEGNEECISIIEEEV